MSCLIRKVILMYIYTEKDLDLISWERIDEFIEKIYSDVKNYLDKEGLKIKYISPILRGGGVPAIKLSHMFNVIDMLPIQLKHNSKTQEIDLKIGLDYLKNAQLEEDECILLVEGNHVTGTTSKVAAKLLRERFGHDANIIYVSLTRDYAHRNSVENTCYTTWGMTTNETKEVSKEECERLGINYSLVSVYPWENIEEELSELNNL